MRARSCSSAIGVPKATLTLALAGALAAPLAAQDDRPSGWHLFGSNELLLERIEVAGDRFASPYAFAGDFVTDRLDLTLEWSDRGGRSLRLHAELVGADNAYLAEDGAVVESLSLAVENGALAVPLRFEAGDLFADVSRRTLQRGVRGLAFELQPQGAQADHSLLLLAATGEPSWRRTVEGGADELAFGGVSYLVAPRSGRGSLSASVVRGNAKPGADVLVPVGAEREQTVGSLAGELRWAGGVRLEGEFAYLVDEADGGSAEEREEDHSVFLQLARGEGGRVGWKLRLEDNGERFVPLGGLGVLANRRLAEASLRIAVAAGGSLQANLQRIHDRVHGSAPRLETDMAGLSYLVQSSRRPGLRLRLAGDYNALGAANGSRDQRFAHCTLEARDRLGGGWELQYGGDFWDVSDDLDAAGDRRSLDHSLSFGRRGPLPGNGSYGVRLGGVWRRQWRSAAYETASPLLDVDLAAGGHRFTLHLSFLEQDFATATLRDLRYSTQGLSYSFARGAHELTLEGGRDLRRPDGAEETDSWRVALRYRLTVDARWGV